MSRSYWKWAIAVLILVQLSGSAGFADRDTNDALAGVVLPSKQMASSIVVRAHSADDVQRIEDFARERGYGAHKRVEELSAIEVTPPAAAYGRALAELTLYPGVLYAEPLYTVAATDTPQDPFYSRQSEYLDPVHAAEAWDIEKGRPEVLVAVLDTGVDVTHADLQGRIWTNSAEIQGNGVDDDGNGCIDDYRGCSFAGAGARGCVSALGGDVQDNVGHGTFVAGIIAANANSAGIVGVARGVTVMPVKVLDCTGTGDTLALTQGILYAAERGADIINISLGGPNESALVREAVRIATERGALIVAASGNSGTDGVFYPARYPEVLAVGATTADSTNLRAPFSTSGPEVDVVAVGEGIVGPVPRASCGEFAECIGSSAYAAGDGTSFAAPQVSGLAALIRSQRPYLSPAAIHGIIRATAAPLPGGAGWSGSGLIHMLNALRPQFRLAVPGTTRN